MEGKSYICLQDGQYHAWLDGNALMELLDSLHWLTNEAPLGEEASISSCGWEELPKRGKEIGYCEFNLTPNYLQKKQGHNIRKKLEATPLHKPHGVYDPENDRLDYFVSSNEIKTALEALEMLLQDSGNVRSSNRTTLFGSLIVHLVLSDQAGW